MLTEPKSQGGERKSRIENRSPLDSRLRARKEQPYSHNTKTSFLSRTLEGGKGEVWENPAFTILASHFRRGRSGTGPIGWREGNRVTLFFGRRGGGDVKSMGKKDRL